MTITPKQRQERLDTAIEVLSQPVAKLPVDRYAQGIWGIRDECGTAACLAGTLSLVPYFRRRGLRGVWIGHPLDGSEYLVPEGDSDTNPVHWIDLVAEVFGLTEVEAEYVISDYGTRLDTRSVREHSAEDGDYRITKATAVRRLRVLRDHYQKTKEPLFSHFLEE